MRTRRSGGGRCKTMYCTNVEEGQLVQKIRDHYLTFKGIPEPEKDIEDRTEEFKVVTPDFVEEIVKIHCENNRGDQQCVIDLFPRQQFTQFSRDPSTNFKPEFKSYRNRRLDIKMLASKVLAALQEYVSPVALAKRKERIERFKAAREAVEENNKKFFAKNQSRLGGRKRKTRKRNPT